MANDPAFFSRMARPTAMERGRKSLSIRISARQFMKELHREIDEDDIFNGAAVLGFYFTLAIFPAMIFVMALLPYLPVSNIDQAIMDLLRQALPQDAAQVFIGAVQEVTSQPRGGLLSFGFLATLWATSSGLYAIMQQLNVTYDVHETRGFIRTRFIAIGLSLLLTVLVIGGFSLIVLGGVLQDWLATYVGRNETLLTIFIIFRWVAIVAGLLLSYALIYYLAPDVKQKFVFITPGSIVGVAVLMGASLGFAWYVQNFGNYNATYGSLGAVIVLMLWLYITGLTLLFGSELNALIEHHSPAGKDKGEHVDGEKERDPAVRQQVQRVAPERHID